MKRNLKNMNKLSQSFFQQMMMKLIMERQKKWLDADFVGQVRLHQKTHCFKFVNALDQLVISISIVSEAGLKLRNNAK